VSLHAIIVQVWGYSWRRCSQECGDVLGGRDRASLEIHLEALIIRTCRP